jgi:CHAT domain-containing protein/tetratricopeptide (TPR) repeat protein
LSLGILVLPGARIAGQEQPDSVAGVRVLLDDGRYDRAEASARALVSRLKMNTGAEIELGTATDVLVEALWQNGKGALPATRALAESALRTSEARLGSDRIELRAPIRGFARILEAAGDETDALVQFRRALSICERAEGNQSRAVVDALNDVAGALILENQLGEATQVLDRALAIQQAHVGATDPALARTLEQIALLLQSKAQYRASQPFLQRALGIREAVGPNHPDLAETFRLLGEERWFAGDYRAARDHYGRAVAVGERTLRPGHPRVAVILRNLASAMFALGDLAEARALRERALSIAEKAYGPTHPELANYLNDVANSDLLQKNYIAARVSYERAMKIVEDRRGPNDTGLATYHLNLAEVNTGLGDFAEARRQVDRAVSIWQRALGADHPFVGRALFMAGQVLFDQKAYSLARGFFERALAIQERALGADHQDVADTLAVLSRTLERQGLLDRSQALAARGLRIWERSDAPNAPGFADVLYLYGELQAARGHFDTAREYYERALAIRRHLLGDSNLLVADAESGLAVTLVHLNEYPLALASALEAERVGQQHLRLTLRYLPERQSLNYATVRPTGLHLALSMLAANAAAAPPVFDALIRSRALVLDEMAARRHVTLDTSRSELAPLWAALVSARQRLANLVVRGPGEQRPDQYAALVEEARRDKELAERSLAEKSASFKDELAREEIGLDEARAALPTGSALVAFVRYDRTPVAGSASATARDSSSMSKGQRTSPPVSSYMALIARSGEVGVDAVSLGTAASIDPLVASWRESATSVPRPGSAYDPEASYRAAGAALRQRIWDPLRKRLNDASMVFVVPDGTLNLVSFDALPVGRTSYLIDQGPVLHYLSAERDLVVNQSTTPATGGLLAVGGAAFDDASSFARVTKRTPAGGTTSSSAIPVVASRRSSCGTLQSMHFEPLAGTGREVRQVAALWKDSPADILQGPAASERAFKRDAPGRRVLHLATHGFFLDEACSPAAAGTRSVGGLSVARKSKPTPGGLSDNPLLLSGLALAGANRRLSAGPDDEDGILTAEEVTAMNLSGVEWAVLSACDTGLGVVKAGEGVFGLRRAFQVAGVRSVIMSLWPVDDDAARLWMRALYQGRLQKHLNTAEAMHAASSSVLRDRRAHGQSTHPFYWAGFVAAGDWR